MTRISRVAPLVGLFFSQLVLRTLRTSVSVEALLSRGTREQELTNDSGQKKNEEISDCEIDDASANQMSEVLLKIKLYKEAIVTLEDVLFLHHKGDTEKAMSLDSTIDAICMRRSAATVQITLDSFLDQH